MPTGLVLSAHAADFVWRAGGAIALHAKRGYRMVVVCMSYGERGESAKLWKQPGMTLEKVKEIRKRETEEAAAVLGAEIIQLDLGDYPLRMPDESLLQIVDLMREIKPDFVLGHSVQDPYNCDHPLARHIAQDAIIIAQQAWGHAPGTGIIDPPRLCLFEPHHSEISQWRPDIYLDISEVWETKRRAFEVMDAQEHLWDYWTRAAQQRAHQAAIIGGRAMTHAECYQSVYPSVVDSLA